MTWLHEMTQRIASESGLDPSSLALSPAAARTLLDVARVAAHSSGERTNAPLLCYVLGIATAKGASLEALARAVGEEPSS